MAVRNAGTQIRAKAAELAGQRADQIVSDIYERQVLRGGLTVKQCRYIRDLQHKAGRCITPLYKTNTGYGGGGIHVGYETSGTLYDPEGNRCGIWKVHEGPNGAGWLSVTKLLTREQIVERVAKLEADHATWVESVMTLEPGTQRDELLANLAAQTAERRATIESGWPL